MAPERTETGPGPYECEECGLTFETEEELREHNRQVHPEMMPEEQPD